jgi:hypothetical protein
VREPLRQTQLAGTCNGHCSCTEPRDSSPAEFVCAHIDCPEFFGNEYDDQSRKCIRQYDREHCCAINTICGKLQLLVF